MDLHNGTLTVVVVSNYTLQATLAQAALQHPTGSAALKEGNTAEAEPTAPLALSGIGVRIIVFKQGYMNIPIETLGFTLTGSIAIPVPTPAIYYADVAFRLLQERHLNPQLARLWPVSTASRRAFVGHRHIRCSCHIIPKYCADGRRGSQYLVNRYTSADSLMPSGDGYGKCAEPRVHDSELRLYSNLLTTPGDNPQHRPLLATVPKGSCAQTLPAKAHPSLMSARAPISGNAFRRKLTYTQGRGRAQQPVRPHALAADLPPSFSIAALLRHAAELDHDAHLEDGSLSNERKREAGSEANVACPPSPGCDDRVPRPRSPEASTSNAPERRHRLSLRERARKSKKRRKASAPPASKSEPAAPSAPGEGSKKTKKNKARKNAKQKADREQEILQHGHQARPAAYKKYVSSAKPVPITVDLDLDSLPASSCGYQAKPKGSTKATVLSLSSLLEEGYTVEAWDGMLRNMLSHPSRANKILVDPITSKIFAACVGRPADESFDKAVDDAFEAMEHVRAVCGFDLDDWLHRRGHFPAFNVGVSYGQGQRAAQNLDIDEKYRKVLQELIKNPAIVRLAHYAS
ncbi:hypothetical protein BKA70DRAFT_1235384, partial [Coprinopsis sp. MPI-PUGE-AT-0042]